MEQTREFRNKASHYGQVIFEKGAKTINSERSVFSTNSVADSFLIFGKTNTIM